jgi:hypothetical protein
MKTAILRINDMSNHPQLRFVLFLLPIVCFFSLSCVTAGESVRDSPDFRAQLTTVSNIRHFCNALSAYESVKDKPPENLEILINNKDYFLDPDKARERLRDGWGRALFYYTNGNTYMLISFGKNGAPDPQLSCGGCTAMDYDYDADIVWIADRWAQSPKDVDQF